MRQKLRRLEPCSLEKQSLRRDLTKACKGLNREEGLNTALSTKSTVQELASTLKFKAGCFRIKKKKNAVFHREECRKCIMPRRKQTENMNWFKKLLNRFTANSSKMGDYGE